MQMRPIATLITVLAITPMAFFSNNAHGAEITHVLTAGEPDNMWDFHLGVNFDQKWTSGQIQREYHCTNQQLGTGGGTLQPGQVGYDANCPYEPRILSAREMDYQRIVSTLNIDAKVGLWHDLQLHLRLPVVLTDKESVKFAPPQDSNSRAVYPYCQPGDQLCSPSSVYREDSMGRPMLDHSLFGVPNDAQSRAGLGDMTFGLAWAPYNQKKDDTAATWKLQFDYTAPTGKQMSPKNTFVGRGLHELSLSSFMSRRFGGIDPYFGLFYTHVIPTADSPFQNYGPGQTLVSPGDRFGLLFGTEFIPWEDPLKRQKFSVDLGAQFIYQFEGRDYSPIYTFLGNSECNDLATCDLTKLGEYKDRDGNYISNPRRTDGITDVEQYGQVNGWLGINVQAAEHVQFRTNFNMHYNFDHFLTNADAGKDNGREVWTLNTQTGEREYTYRPGRIDPFTDEVNPVFNRHLDPIGRRLKIVQNWTFALWVTGTLTF